MHVGCVGCVGDMLILGYCSRCIMYVPGSGALGLGWFGLHTLVCRCCMLACIFRFCCNMACNYQCLVS